MAREAEERERAGEERQKEAERIAFTREEQPLGPWIQLFGGAVYSYPTHDPQEVNEVWRMTTGAWWLFTALATGIASYGWRNALILHGVAFGVEV